VTPPVLLLVFNRPAIVRAMLSALRGQRPDRVYVAADGPRATHPADVERCASVLEEVQRGIDWPCELEVLHRPSNVGLQQAVVSGIDWFFTHESAGVILEDDCVPAADFLRFADEMLARYAHVPEVMHVSGLTMRATRTGGAPPDAASYHFAQVGHVWGWATWRRAWARFDPTLEAWPTVRSAYRNAPSALRRALAAKFASAHAGRKWTWSRAWYWSMLQHDAFSVIPSVNMIHNIGDGADATHQHGARHPLRVAHEGSLAWPLVHPSAVATDPAYDAMLATYHRGSVRRRLSDTWWAMQEVLA
jgi:hypothetical protein